MKKKHEDGILTKSLQNSYMPMTTQRFKKCIFGVKSNPRRQKMKRKSAWFGLIGLLFTVVLWGSFSQTGEDLFQKALRLERNEGKLVEAIEIYNTVVAEGKNKSLAAQAQLRIGLCYEKLGQKSVKQAQEAFQKVIDNFPGQTEAVKVAQEKLSIFLKAQSAIAKVDKEFNIRKVWASPGTDVTGAPSPDGKYLSFVDWNTGDLAIHDLVTGKKRRLTDKGSWFESSEFALFSKWSPDGKKIVYNWFNKEECFDLRIVELDNPKHRVLFPMEKMEYIHPFDWSPDGHSILAAVYQEQGGEKAGLISIEDGSFRVLKVNDREVLGLRPPVLTFSPDGKYLAFSFPPNEDTQNCDIFLMSIDGKHETPLISHPMNDLLLGWAPDGKWIFFISDRTGTRDAWIAGVDDGKLKQSPLMIKKEIGFIRPMGFTQNGSFYYGVDTQMTDIYSIQVDSFSGKILSPPKKATLHYEGSNRYPAYSSDGKYLAYVSTRGPRPLSRSVLCTRDVKTGKERELNPGLGGFTSPRWSPDGRFISVEVEDKNDDHYGICLVDAQTGDIDPIIQIEPEEVIFSHRWSKDGKTIFYTRSESEVKVQPHLRKSHIYVHDVVSGQEKMLTGSPGDAKDIDISPDGQMLVLLNRDVKRTLRIIPASGGEPRDIYSFEQPGGGGSAIISPTWIAGGKYILFLQERTDSDDPYTHYELVRIPVEGGELQGLGLEMLEFRHFSVHPDGQQIVFHSRGAKIVWPEVWVMENFLPKNDNMKK
jgi:Tol biopolymer transport system component